MRRVIEACGVRGVELGVRYTRGSLPLIPPAPANFSFNNSLCDNSKISPLWTVLFRLAGNRLRKNVVISLLYQKGGVKSRLSEELRIVCKTS